MPVMLEMGGDCLFDCVLKRCLDSMKRKLEADHHQHLQHSAPSTLSILNISHLPPSRKTLFIPSHLQPTPHLIMSRHVLGMGLLAVTATAQANFASSGFEYIGCVEADPQVFGLNLDFIQAFTPQECQDACAGKATFAAVGGGCRCDVAGDELEITFQMIDESACATPCIPEDPEAGNCGGPSDDESTQIFNLYRKSSSKGECDDEMDAKAAKPQVKVAEVPVVITHTVTSCPPEKLDCPLHAATKVACPPGGCQPAPAPAPAPPATPEPAPAPPAFNKVAACPPEGCRQCPPEGCLPCTEDGCLPACPEGCVAPPAPESAPTPTPIVRAPVCPGDECVAPSTLTPAPYISGSAPISPPAPEPQPEENPNEPPAASGSRQKPVANLEMLTIMGAAILLLAF